MLKSLRREIKKRPSIFTMEQIDDMYDTLMPLTDVTEEEKEQHIENILKRSEPKPVQSPVLCPKCNAPMILRTATKGANQGKQFYGCSNFPNCRAIVNIEKNSPA